MIVGEGRAGKTAFSNSIVGKPFTNTESTIGVHNFTCDVNFASLGKGQWAPCDKPVRELELAIAEGLSSTASSSSPHLHEQVDLCSFLQNERNIEQQRKDQVVDTAQQTRGAVSATGSSGSSQATSKDASKSGGADSLTKISAGSSTNKPVSDLSVSSASQHKPDVATKLQPAPRTLEVDNELVAKCLSKSIENGRNLIISVFDYGGQSVFNAIHNIFLTKYGVYTVVFNMELLLQNDTQKELCLSFIRFWVNSIISHTYSASAQSTAPIAFVGTRKDTIHEASDHAKINQILYNQFSSSVAWSNVVENSEGTSASGRTTFCFFPVNNKLSNQDPSMKHLMACLEKVMDESEYTHKHVPLSWMRVLDEFKRISATSSCITYDVVMGLTTELNVPSDQVDTMLYFFHEMGHLIWNPEPILRGVVILDPICFFVKPVTIIICKHQPTDEDPTWHLLDVHKLCDKKQHSKWVKFIQKGILDMALLDILWKDYVEFTDVLLRLMTQFGLIVPLSGSNAGQFIVPAMLPTCSNSPIQPFDMSCSCVFAFSIDSSIVNQTIVKQSELSLSGFLPSGIYERIVGRTIAWCEQTSLGVEIDYLQREEIVLTFGKQTFKLQYLPHMHSIRLEINGNNPKSVHSRLLDMIQEVVDESTKNLYFSTLLPLSASGAKFVLLKTLQDLVQNSLPLKTDGAQLSPAALLAEYGPWLQIFELLLKYHGFFSYRWGKRDQQFVTMLFDRLALFSVGSTNRPIDMFLDVKRLKDGDNFATTFCKALFTSSVFIPIFSLDAMSRMLTHDATKVDNLLLEWLLAIVFEKHKPAGNLFSIYPIMFGAVDPLTDIVGSVFA